MPFNRTPPYFQTFLRPCHSLQQPNTTAIIVDSGRLRGATGAARAGLQQMPRSPKLLGRLCGAVPGREELAGNVT